MDNSRASRTSGALPGEIYKVGGRIRNAKQASTPRENMRTFRNARTSKSMSHWPTALMPGKSWRKELGECAASRYSSERIFQMSANSREFFRLPVKISREFPFIRATSVCSLPDCGEKTWPFHRLDVSPTNIGAVKHPRSEKIDVCLNREIKVATTPDRALIWQPN